MHTLLLRVLFVVVACLAQRPFEHSQQAVGGTCAGFFNVLVLTQTENCTTVLKKREPYLRSLQLQFMKFKTTVTVYLATDVAPHPAEKTSDSAPAAAQQRLQQCIKSYSPTTHPNIIFQHLLPSTLLDQAQVAGLVDAAAAAEITSWPSTVENAVVRGDVFRLLVALLEGAQPMAYVDADTVLLGPVQAHFQREFVTLTLFEGAADRNAEDAGSGLVAEMTKALTGDTLSFENRERLFNAAGRFNLAFSNAAFCLSRETARAVLSLQMDRIRAINATGERRQHDWRHFGSSVFSHSFLNLDLASPVPAFFVTNPPKLFDKAAILSLMERRGLRVLHLSGFELRDITAQNRQHLSSFDVFVQTILEQDALSYSYSNPRPSINTSISISTSINTSISISTSASATEVVQGDVSPASAPLPMGAAAAQQTCRAGLFATVDGILAGSSYRKRGDCCLQMREPYFRSLLVEASRQAQNMSTTLTIFANSDTEHSRCGTCFAQLYKTLQYGGASRPAFEIRNVFDRQEAQANSLAQQHLQAAIQRKSLLLGVFSSEALLREAGLTDLPGMDEILGTVAIVTRSYDAVQFAKQATYAVNESFVTNAVALELHESLTILCLAAKHARAFVALNVLVLDLRDPRVYLDAPFLALASKRSRPGKAQANEANVFVTSYAFCAPAEVLLEAARSVVATHRQRDDGRHAQIEAQREAQKQKRLAWTQAQKAWVAKRRRQADNKMGPKLLQAEIDAALASQPALEMEFSPYWEEEADVEDHELILAQALQDVWIRTLNGGTGGGAGLRLLTLCSPHHLHVGDMLADIAALGHKLAVVSSALVEKALRQRLRARIYAERGITVGASGKLVVGEPYKAPVDTEEIVGKLIRAIRGA